MTINRRDLLRGGGMAAAVAAGGIATAGAASAQPQPVHLPAKWDHEADVIVVGSGASGFPAAIRARESGASVIIVEAQPHTGGHGTCSGGNVPLGGGTSRQKKYGIVDSPDLYFRDLTDWSVVEGNGFPDYRYNDREVIRAFADHSPIVFEWLIEQGVVFVEMAPDTLGGGSVGTSVPRENHAAVMDWPMVQTGGQADPSVRATMSSGNGLIRPLEATAAKKGVQVILEHKMIALHRQASKSGRVLGIAADNNGKLVNIRARKAVILATGGSSTNVNFRRMFDPRLTEEYCGIAGQPWSDQDASGELAAMEIGASLWGGFNETGEFGSGITKPGHIGTQYGYVNLTWMPTSKVFDKARAIGLQVKDWQDLILVNMIGKRFYDETGPQYSAGNYKTVDPYDPWSWRNVQNVKFSPHNWINAALAGIGDAHNGGGPIWAIFDNDAVAREKWDLTPPHVDTTGFFFSGNTLAELAGKIQMKYQRVPMPPQNLEDAVARYNGFVDKGVDDDFAKPKPLYKIAKPPFYAAWSTPVIHDTRVGLRINGKGQVMDMNAQVIAGLYSCGENGGRLQPTRARARDVPGLHRRHKRRGGEDHDLNHGDRHRAPLKIWADMQSSLLLRALPMHCRGEKGTSGEDAAGDHRSDNIFDTENFMTRQIGQSLLTLVAAAALFAAPAFAQSSGGGAPAPAPAAPAAAPAAPAAPAATMAPGMKMAPAAKTAAAKPKHKFSCYDYAWQSKDMQDCLAKAKPAAAKKPAAKAAPAKKSS